MPDAEGRIRPISVPACPWHDPAEWRFTVHSADRAPVHVVASHLQTGRRLSATAPTRWQAERMVRAQIEKDKS